ncbi:MAG: peptide ABC transporter substrate-binding protein [Chloroflexota bacterium]
MFNIQEIYRRPVFWLIVLLAPLIAVACVGPAAQPEAATEPTDMPIETAIPVEAAPSPTVEAETSGERGAGDTLRLLLWQAPTTLNPNLVAGSKDLVASRITYEPLASFDAAGKLVPFLAAEIPSLENGGVAEDGKSVTWKLKPDVKWSDGEPFTAGDVLFTYEYITNPAVNSSSVSEYDAIERVEVVDDQTVTLHFKEVNPAWTLPFVGVRGMILPRHIFAASNGPNAQAAPANLAPVGTGPYRFVEFKKEDMLIIGEDAVNTVKIIYEPNPFFRETDKPFFNRLELQGGGDAMVAAQAVFQNNQVDFAWNMQGVDDETLAQFEAAGQGKVVAQFGPRVERIFVNFTDPNRETKDGERSSIEFPHPFFSDKKVRQALTYAIDREAIAKLYGRTGQATANILVSPAIYDSPNTSYEFNLDKAAALLDEAGWIDSDGDGIREKDGVKLGLVYQTSVNPLRQQIQEMVKKWLESIGFEVELKFIDASIFFSSDVENTNTRGHFYADLQQYGFNNKSPDPGAYLKLWTCDQAPQKANNWATFNDGRYCNPAYDDLYRQSTTEIDPEKRRQLLIQMNDLLVEDVAMIPLAVTAEVSAVSNTLEGFNPTPWDVETWNIQDWRRK